MRVLACSLLGLGSLGFLTISTAQPPEKSREGQPAPIVERMMAYDKNKDGKISKDEVPEERAQRLFQRADANKDGFVTREELTALAAQEAAVTGGRRPDGKGGDGDKGRFQRPVPGQILHPFFQEALHLTADQKKQLEELQNQVNSKLKSILTDEQKKQLHDMREGGRFEGRPGDGRPKERKKSDN